LNNFFAVYLTIAPVAVITLIGFLWGKLKGAFDRDTISTIILYIASPCLIFSVISQKEFLWQEYGLILLAGFFVILGVALLVWLFLKITKREDLKGFYLPTMLMNTGNFGFPVVLFAFGESGLAKAIIFDLALVIMMYTVALSIVGGRKNLFMGLKLPILYSAAIALLISFFKIPVPNSILRITTMLGHLTIPLMLLILGHRLSSVKLVSWRLSVLGMLFRSLGGLFFGLLFVSIFPLASLTKKVILLYAALPSAMMSTVLSQKYHQNEELVASVVATSTLSALVFIPILLYFIR
jgi:malate permease and related proteins